MRKSEALAVIKKTLAGFTPDDVKACNWILEDLLALGMVPSRTVKIYNAESGNHITRTYFGDWEPEEIKKSGTDQTVRPDPSSTESN